jgi:hypothetical protein
MLAKEELTRIRHFISLQIYVPDRSKITDANFVSSEFILGDVEDRILSQDLMAEFLQSILSFLGISKGVDNAIVCKKINEQPSPRRECISILVL